MTGNVAVSLISAGAAVIVSVSALVVNAVWMGKTFDQLLARLVSVETKIDLLTGSLHHVDKRLGLLEDRMKR